MSIATTILLPLFEKSSTGCFSVALTIVFLHVALISDPPDEPAISGFKDIFCIASGRILPAVALATTVYLVCIQDAHQGRRQTRLSWTSWLTGLWSGALCNFFGQLFQDGWGPKAQKILLIFLTATLYFIICRIRKLHREQQLTRCLTLYGLLIVGLYITNRIFGFLGLRLHIHHYLWPLLLLPGASTCGPYASFYEGLLLGISTNGIARWGFDNLAEVQGPISDKSVESLLLNMISPIINGTHISFEWSGLPNSCNGINILVNDVLRFQDFNPPGGHSFVWRREDLGLPLYFRFGAITEDKYRGLTMGDTTGPAVWHANGTWSA
ncbi:uncharacterized protein A1O9_05614 [Exophiala aquamarina CBS 119918]|uniref:Uncharacterized protein n=1 Tax=Exophiala aquamarina CBS 119918 TaxID=1182545 RepID=A0A072PCY0_9EURO|nr:uncharacterized protein A1O9_05614 [Exophiala aquamarina CBS 119918]KEF57696.1 hypothetical protein A1O9_05614 [Exophiala aquamarina CBS 119918]